MDNLKKIEAFLDMPSDDDMVYGEALTEDFEENDLPAEIRIPASELCGEYDEYYDDEDGELYTELNIYIEDNYGATPVDFHWVITPDEIIISDITWSDGEDIEPEVEEQEVDFPEDDVMEDLNEAKLRKNDLTDENLANFRMELQEIKDNLADFGPEGLYAVPYESFKKEFPIFTEKVIESFLDEMGDDGEGDWQEGELIWENDWPCLIEGAEKLLDGKGFQWEKIYTKHYKPTNESLNEAEEANLNPLAANKIIRIANDLVALQFGNKYYAYDIMENKIRDEAEITDRSELNTWLEAVAKDWYFNGPFPGREPKNPQLRKDISDRISVDKDELLNEAKYTEDVDDDGEFDDDYDWSTAKVPQIGLTYTELVDEMEQYGIDIVNDYDPKVAIKEYVKEFYNVSRYTADYIANVIVNNCYNILNMIDESLEEGLTEKFPSDLINALKNSNTGYYGHRSKYETQSGRYDFENGTAKILTLEQARELKKRDPFDAETKIYVVYDGRAYMPFSKDDMEEISPDGMSVNRLLRDGTIYYVSAPPRSWTSGDRRGQDDTHSHELSRDEKNKSFENRRWSDFNYKHDKLKSRLQRAIDDKNDVLSSKLYGESMDESLNEENEKHLYICDDCGYEVELTDDEYDGMCPNCHEHHGFYRADESLTEASRTKKFDPENTRYTSDPNLVAPKQLPKKYNSKAGAAAYEIDPESIKKAVSMIYDMSEEDNDKLIDVSFDAYFEKDPEALKVVKGLFKKYKIPMWALGAWMEDWNDPYSNKFFGEE